MIRGEFSSRGFDHSKLDDQECVVRWQSWNLRIVTAKVRSIQAADTFSCPPEHQKGLDGLNAAFRDGKELLRWQSKLVEKIRFEDGLLNDFGVHHFHLGETIGASGYIERTGPLLFAVVRDDVVYEAGIYHHGEWYDFEILNTIDRNWPSLLEPVTLKGVVPATTFRDRDDLKRLREANINPVLQLDSGRVIVCPGWGSAMDGTSFEAVTSADHWAKFLRNADKGVMEQVNKWIADGTLPPKDYRVALDASDSEIAALVENWRILLWRKK